MTNDDKQINRAFSNKIVFFMICGLPIFANIIFGAVSTAMLGLLSLAFGLLLIFWILDILRSGEIRLSSNLLQLPLAGLIGIGLIQLLPLGGNSAAEILSIESARTLTLDPNATRFAVAKLFIFLGFFSAALVYINNPQRLRKVVFTIVIFGAIMAFVGILQRLASPNLIYGMRKVDYAQPIASYINSHHFAAFMEMTIGLTLALVFGNALEKDKRLLMIIAIVLMGIVIVLTGSRGGFLSLIAVIGFLVTMTIRYRVSDKAQQTPEFRNNLKLIGGSIALVVLLLVSVIWLGQDGSVQRLGGVNQTDFANGRIHFWSVSLQIIRDNPIIGSGLEAFGVAFTKYDTWNGQLRVEHAHNDYLQTLTDSGLLGLLMVFAFIFILFRKSLSVIKESKNPFRRAVAIGALSGCFGIIFHSLFDFPLRTNANFLFFLLLAVLATTSIEYPKLLRKKRRVKQPNAIRG